MKLPSHFDAMNFEPTGMDIDIDRDVGVVLRQDGGVYDVYVSRRCDDVQVGTFHEYGAARVAASCAFLQFGAHTLNDRVKQAEAADQRDRR